MISNVETELLNSLGFDSWFEAEIDTKKLSDFVCARVLAVHKESCVIANGVWQARAEVTGKLMFSAESPLDYPTVGDWCYVQFLGADSTAIIHEVLPRKSILKRKTPGKRVEFQAIASNIDTAFIIQSLDEDFSMRRLERYLVMAREGNIEPIVLFSKKDLVNAGELAAKLEQVQKSLPDLRVFPFSSETKEGLNLIDELLTPANTFCLLGSSGVGKTTLLNRLIGESVFETQAVREKDSKGKHTTTNRQLVILKSGAMMIDTPGMRELGNIGVESGIDTVFDEIAELETQCKFSDCSHTQEVGCALLEAVSAREIDGDRYDSFMKLRSESAYNERSYKERRDHSKKFGKLYKSVQKNNRKNQ